MKFVDDPKFQTKWAAVKQTNKERLAHYVEVTTGHKINTKAMFDVQIKVRFRICEIAVQSVSNAVFVLASS